MAGHCNSPTRLRRMRTTTRTLTLMFVAALCAACAGTSGERDRRREMTAEQLYADARSAMQVGNWRTAVQRLEDLDSRYPFGPYAQQAQLDLLFAYYQARDTASATSAADRFIRQNARHPKLDYVYYMKGLVNFSAELGFLREAFAAPLSERDASTAKQAFDDFNEMIKRFPDSQYANDARQRMIYLRNRLAEFEMHVANYYVSRKAWLAAANRARYIIENFPGADIQGDALELMVNCYRELKMPELEKEAMAVLTLNYPEKARALGQG